MTMTPEEIWKLATQINVALADDPLDQLLSGTGPQNYADNSSFISWLAPWPIDGKEYLILEQHSDDSVRVVDITAETDREFWTALVGLPREEQLQEPDRSEPLGCSCPECTAIRHREMGYRVDDCDCSYCEEETEDE